MKVFEVSIYIKFLFSLLLCYLVYDSYTELVAQDLDLASLDFGTLFDIYDIIQFLLLIGAIVAIWINSITIDHNSISSKSIRKKEFIWSEIKGIKVNSKYQLTIKNNSDKEIGVNYLYQNYKELVQLILKEAKEKDIPITGKVDKLKSLNIN